MEGGSSAPKPPDARCSLRPAEASDREFLFELYASTREAELAQVDWPAEIRLQFLRQQFEAQDAHYRTYFHDTSYDVVLVDAIPAGRLYVGRWRDEIRIVDIALLPAYCGRGVGTELISRLIAEADASGRKTSIHVERQNPALRLYERLGFRLAEDKGVYLFLERTPGESPRTPPAP